MTVESTPPRVRNSVTVESLYGLRSFTLVLGTSQKPLTRHSSYQRTRTWPCLSMEKCCKQRQPASGSRTAALSRCWCLSQDSAHFACVTKAIFWVRRCYSFVFRAPVPSKARSNRSRYIEKLFGHSSDR